MKFATWLFLALLAINGSAQFGLSQLMLDHEHAGNAFGKAHDIDGDNDIDVFQFCDGEFAWYENGGDGRAWTRHLILSVGAGGAGGHTATYGDPDGDADIDMLVHWNGVGTFLYENSGQGEFEQSEITSAELPWTTSLTMADFNGDGAQDVLGIGFVGVDTDEFWYEYQGAGQLQAHGALPAGPYDHNRLEHDDLDGDGFEDILMIGTDTVRAAWMAGDGAGNFSPAQPLLYWPHLVRDVRPFDLDADGDLDLLAAYDDPFAKLGWLERSGAGFQPVVELMALPTYGAVAQLGVADMDQNGSSDLVFTTTSAIAWIPDLSLGSDSLLVISKSFLAPQTQELVDMDGDTDLDVLLSGVNWKENTGAGEFGTIIPIAQGLSLGEVVQADMDDDGNLDLLMSGPLSSRLALFKTEEQSQPGDHILLDTEANGVRWIATVDDDGDGDLDIVAHHVSTEQLVRYNASAPSVFDEPIVVLDSVANGSSFTIGDMDGDGDEDVVFGGYFTRGLFWIERVGAGAYGPVHQLDTTDYFNAFSIVDINGDGMVDLVANVGAMNRVQAYAGSGAGAFDPAQVIVPAAQYPNFCQLFDADADGDPDLLSTDQDRRLSLYVNDGNGVFTGPSLLDPQGADVLWARLGDIDSDGDPDVIATFEDWTMGWFKNNGSGVFAARIPVTTSLGDFLLGPFDLDGDSDLDVLYVNAYFGDIRWFESFMDGSFSVNGRVFADMNMNGARDMGEPSLVTVPVRSDPPMAMAFSADSGAYSMYLPAGTYSILAQPQVPVFWTQTTDQLDLTFTLDSVTPVANGLDIGFAPGADTTVVQHHVEVFEAPCGGLGAHRIQLRNDGTTNPKVKVAYSYDPVYQFDSSIPPPDSLLGNTVYWTVPYLPWLQPVDIQCTFINPSSAVVQNVGTAINVLNCTMLDSAGIVLGLGSDTFDVVLACAYDPNDKQVSPVGYGEHGAVPLNTQRLTYSIRFQNTGTAQAFNVMLRDRLDAGLDRSTLRIEGSSHTPSSIKMEADGELVVRFDGINLPDSGSNYTASQGYFAFSIEPAAGSSHLDDFTNQAEIYFDFEAAVATNTVTTTLVDCSLWEPTINLHPFGYLEASPGYGYHWLLDGIAMPADTARTLVPIWDGDYTVQVTNAYGCTAESDPYQIILTGLVAPPAVGMRVVPSPFTGSTMVYFHRVLTNADQLVLTDAAGRLLGQWKPVGLQRFELQRGGSANGMYCLTLLTNGVRAVSTRVVVE